MSAIPYEILDQNVLDSEAKAARTLEEIYHKGQDRIWDGRTILSELTEQYGEPNLSPEKLESIRRIFSVILWGELAAWKVSAELALKIDDFGPKMAATSQAHDEARHFYVMRDYLNHINCEPVKLPSSTEKFLSQVLTTDDMTKKLLGMQLMVEPVAITIFKFVRMSEVEPVLCELLSYYERDEARHIALGVKYLPGMIKELSYTQVIGLVYWQIRAMMIEVDGLRELEEDFRRLGFEPEDVFRHAEKRQLDALHLLSEQMDLPKEIWEPIRRLIVFKKDMTLNQEERSFLTRISEALKNTVAN